MPGSSPPLKVFITGASGGLGAALARHYGSRSGACLGLAGRRAEALDELAQSLPCETASYVADVRDAGALARAGADFMGRYGCPELVFANAGVSAGTLTECPEDLAVFREIVETNLLGVVHTFHPFVEAMRRARQGTLVGIASLAGFRGLPGAGAYSASKAGVIAYLESLRLELRNAGVAVVTICPGYIRTPMTAGNPYFMPFLLDAERAAARIAAMAAKERRHGVVPWPMAVVGAALKALPRPVYDILFERAPRKPRRRG